MDTNGSECMGEGRGSHDGQICIKTVEHDVSESVCDAVVPVRS